jgi:hypothetical protein
VENRGPEHVNLTHTKSAGDRLWLRAAVGCMVQATDDSDVGPIRRRLGQRESVWTVCADHAPARAA